MQYIFFKKTNDCDTIVRWKKRVISLLPLSYLSGAAVAMLHNAKASAAVAMPTLVTD